MVASHKDKQSEQKSSRCDFGADHSSIHWFGHTQTHGEGAPPLPLFTPGVRVQLLLDFM